MHSSHSTEAAAPAGGDALGRLAAEIAAHPFFAGMPAELLPILAADAMDVEFPAGEWIFQEGEPANRFYLIVSGHVSIESRHLGRSPLVVQEIGAGDVLGWSWLFPPFVWMHSARVVEPTRAIFFYGTRLREQCDENHDLGYEIMRRTSQVVIQRLQATRRRLRELRHGD